MKNIIFTLIIAIIAYGLWQYSQPSQELIDAKKELGIQADSSVDSQINDAKKEIFEQVDDAISGKHNTGEDSVRDNTPSISVELISGNDILQMDKIEIDDLSDGRVDLTGKITGKVDTIKVLFSNTDSDFPDDSYDLKQFVPGSDTFLYRAYSQYKTFDYGTNVYTILMNSGREESTVQLTIYYPNPDNAMNGGGKQGGSRISNEVINTVDLPASGDYGSPIKTGENKITYSDLKGFELEKHSALLVDCSPDLITNTIAEKTSSWSWWNTCRPSKDELYVTFYALNMVDGKYVYAKHYFSNHYYAMMELSTGSDEVWNTLESLNDKNTWLKNKDSELREGNDTYEITKITDTLFENIIKK